MKYANKLQTQYDQIYSFFKHTTPFYDDLDWDGEVLLVWFKDEVIERYTLDELKEIFADSGYEFEY